MKRIPHIFKNFYFLVGIFFIAWMLFVDTNDFYSQYVKKRKLGELEKQRAYYEVKIQEVQKDRQELLSDQDLLEKFAREKYLMRKETEDLYVIVSEE